MGTSQVNLYPEFYNVLEVNPGARASVIQAAYRALMKEIHPDRGGNQADVSKVTEAYNTLSDPAKRKQYDKKDRLSEGSIVGNYRIIAEIAEGGFGTTYRGENIVAGEPVCIKHCRHVSAAYERVLIDEAKAIWDLRHYSLPVMRDFLRLDDGSLALVMSYIPGMTLEQIVQKAGRIDPESLSWIVERVLNALMYLHYNGVVHGDIKPQNIIVQPDKHAVVLVDFGLSVVKPTSTSDAKGFTPVFCSPEQLTGSPLLPESDFYSLAKTMLFALSGSVESVERLEVPEDLPDALCDFIKRLLVKSVLGRPNWKKENLFETFQTVRERSFGRKQSGMKAIVGF